MPLTYAGYPCEDPDSLYEACRAADPPLPVDGWFGRCNLFRLENGRGPGAGCVLIRRATLDRIDLTKSHDLVFDDAAGNVVPLKKIVVTRAVNVSPSFDDDPAAVYRCDMADRRHFLAKIPIDKGYNLKNAAGTGYLSGTLNAGAAWTWQQIVTDLTTALSIPDLTLPFTPHGTPENLAFYGGWAWGALNAVMDRLACAVDYDPTADTFAAVRLGADDAEADAEVRKLLPDRVWDAGPLDPARGWMPEKIRVRFPRRPLPSGGTSPYYTKDITLTATAGVEAGTYVQLDDDLTAVGATGTPSNSSTLDARAQERADDWVRKRRYYDRPAQVVYRGHPAKVGTVVLGRRYGRAAWEDRGQGMKAELGSAPDGAMERWRPDVPPGGGGNGGGDTGGGGGAAPQLATVVSTSGGPSDPKDHTVQPKQLSATGSPSDTGVTREDVFVYGGSALANGCPVVVVESGDGDVAFPIGPASGTQEGWVNLANQTLGAAGTNKGFHDISAATATVTSRLTAAVSDIGQGARPAGFSTTTYPTFCGGKVAAGKVGSGDNGSFTAFAGNVSTANAGTLAAGGVSFYDSLPADTVTYGRDAGVGSANIVVTSTGLLRIEAGGGSVDCAYALKDATNTLRTGAYADATATGGLVFKGGLYVSGAVDAAASLGFTPLNPANNLSEVADADTARTNLGLGGGVSATYTFGGGASGDVASITVTNGIITGVTTVP